MSNCNICARNIVSLLYTFQSLRLRKLKQDAIWYKNNDTRQPRHLPQFHLHAHCSSCHIKTRMSLVRLELWTDFTCALGQKTSFDSLHFFGALEKRGRRSNSARRAPSCDLERALGERLQLKFQPGERVVGGSRARARHIYAYIFMAPVRRCKHCMAKKRERWKSAAARGEQQSKYLRWVSASSVFVLLIYTRAEERIRSSTVFWCERIIKYCPRWSLF